MEHYNHDIDAQFEPDIGNSIITFSKLGNTIDQMKRHWTSLHLQGQPVFLTEFPAVDVNQIVDSSTGMTLMDFTLTCLAMVQEQQRREALHRQAIGIQNAREKGIRLGRRPLVKPKHFYELVDRVIDKQMTVTAASRELGVDYKTFRKWMRESREEQEGS